MAKLSNKGLLAIALVLSLMTSLLVYNYLQRATDKANPKDGVPVVMAKANIPPKTKITAEMLQEIKVPAEYVQPGAVSDLKSVVGIIARENILAGEQVTERRLVREGRAVGFTGIIPRDKRALSVAVNEVTGVAGFIKPGDYVDVVVTFEQNMAGDNVSHMMLQNILVLAANRDAEDGVTATGGKDGASKEPLKTSTITLAVTPDEAAKLTLAKEKGKINLALRPYLPLNGIEITNVVTPKDVVGIQFSPVSNNQSSGREQAPPPQPVYISKDTGQGNTASSDSRGIQVIRGTKAEKVPIN